MKQISITRTITIQDPSMTSKKLNDIIVIFLNASIQTLCFVNYLIWSKLARKKLLTLRSGNVYTRKPQILLLQFLQRKESSQAVLRDYKSSFLFCLWLMLNFIQEIRLCQLCFFYMYILGLLVRGNYQFLMLLIFRRDVLIIYIWALMKPITVGQHPNFRILEINK